MTDTSAVTVLSIDGRNVDVRVRNLPAAGLNGDAVTRSFALMLLFDSAKPWKIRSSDSATVEECAIFRALKDSELWETSFYEQNLDNYIESAKLLSSTNFIDEDNIEVCKELDCLTDEMEANNELSASEKEERLCELFHFSVFRFCVTNTKWISHLKKSMVFTSCAHDAWGEEDVDL